MSRSELFDLKGETDGTSLTGDFPLYSDIIYVGTAPYTAPTKVVLPKGAKAKIWFKEVSGAPVNIQLYFSKDATAASPTWVLLENVTLAASGTTSIDKRRPHVIRSIAGTEGFKLSWTQSGTPGKSYVTIAVEITFDD